MAKEVKPAGKRGRGPGKAADLTALSQALLQTTGAGIYIVQNGKFVYVSPLAVRSSRYTKTEMREKYCLDLVHPEDRERVRAKAIESLRNPSSSHPYEYRLIRKKGPPIWVLERVTPIEYQGQRAVMGSFLDITEKKQVEEALSSSEQKYRTILEEMEDACYEVDLEGNYVYVNEAMCRNLQYTREELIGKNYSLVVPAEHLDMLYQVFLKVHETGQPNRGIAHKITRKDGLTGFAESSVTLLRNPEGEPDGFLCVGRDITRHIWLEEELRRSEEKHRKMLEQMQDGYYEVDLAGNFTFANDAACRVLGFPIEALLGTNFGVLTDPAFLKPVFSAFHEVFKTGKPNKAFANKIIRRDGSTRYAESSIALLKNERGEAVGFSCVGRDVTERKALEEALARSEERFRTILERMQDSYYEIDRAGNYTYVNDAVLSHLGYSREELIGKSYRLTTPEGEHKDAFRAFNEVYRTGLPNGGFSHKVKRKDGNIRYVESSIDLRRDESGEIIGFSSVSRDITERKEMEEALARSEEKYRTIIEQMPDSYYELDLKGRYTFANPALARTFGYSMEELAGEDYRSFVPDDEVQNLFNAYNAVYRTGLPNRGFTHKSRRKDGSIIFLESSIDLIRNAAGQAVGFRTVSRDITERKLLEDDLRQSEERYRAILEEMEDAYYEVAIGGDFIFVNDQTCRDTGYTREELIGVNFRKLTPASEHRAIYGAYLNVFTTGESNKGYAHKIIRKDGSMLYVEAAISLMKDKQGQIIGFRSVSRDVTQRKRLEEDLSASEEKYRTILEQIQDSYYEVDLAGNFLFANEATCRASGKSMEELIGSNYQALIPDDDKMSVYSAFDQVFETGVPNRAFAHRVIMPDKNVGYVEVSISPLKDRDEQTMGFRCLSRDVTTRKQMEQLLADMATHDFLTGLPNRVLLIDRFEVALAQAQRKGYKLAVMSMDLDRFKEVNDTKGHSTGDEILKQVADKLVGLVRSSDTVARLGGDEFLLLLQEIHNLDDAATIADKIINSFKNPFSVGDRQLYISTSIGIALCPDDGTELETLIKKSDDSMYYSKRRGGSQYKVHHAGDPKEFS